MYNWRTNRAAPLNRGLVAWWLRTPAFINTSTLNWNDLIYKNDGVLVSGAFCSGMTHPGGWGSVVFDGSDDGVTISNPGSEFQLTSFTFAVWVNPLNLTGFQRIFSADLAPGDGQNYYSFLFNGAKIAYQINNSGHANVSSGSISNSVWTHLIVTFNNATDTIAYFINGLKDANTYTDTSTPTASVAYIRIGSTAQPVQFYGGKLDDLRIYDRALLDDEASNLYRASATGYLRELNWSKSDEEILSTISAPVLSVRPTILNQAMHRSSYY